ncbi:Fic family protein [Hymenobacter sp. RP-2-7]|uniref:Fic family protein n=1 Tax=Hymenobacter polaris TaxID=2682546 RepID=A0A7Y0FNB6_9BACT|nr:Fic family protein [Hymenobacter polaris]NML66299.1 Fic family protein [Hymenobacter polaris]
MAQYSPAVQTLLDRIDNLQAQIEVLRPVKPELVDKIFQKYRLDWNYNSNSIEGNSLNYGETVAFIMEGLTAKGKPLKDHLDIKGHNEAIDFLVDMQQQGSELTERDIRGLHQMILVEPYQSRAQTADGQVTSKTIQLGVYKSSPNHVETRTGQIHYYATPEETPAKMHELMEWYRANRKKMHPLVLSALFHHRFVAIHPFDDGNGRMSRLLSNLILMQANFPPIVVRKENKSIYYSILNQADAGLDEPLIEYFAELLIHSLEIYLKGMRGEDISEVDDLDKELDLFIASFDDEELTKEPLSVDIIKQTNSFLFKPLLYLLEVRLLKISRLFFKSNAYITITTAINGNSGTTNGISYESVPIVKFYSDFAPNLHTYILDYFKKNTNIFPKNFIHLKINFIFEEFKPNFPIESLNDYIAVNFYLTYFTVHTQFSNGKIFKGGYPKSLSEVELNNISDIVIKEMMDRINAKIKDSRIASD